MSAVRWLVKFGAAAAIVLVACGFATVRFGSGLQMPETTTRDGTLITLSRYMRGPVPDIVLMGSSLTFRLKEEYFATPGVRNLALVGGSPVTGLEIVANQPQIPGLILVEANVLSRAADAVLVERYSHGNTEPFFFRPVRAAVAAYEQRRHAPRRMRRSRTTCANWSYSRLAISTTGSMRIARSSSSIRRIRRSPRGPIRNGSRS
jgi:hypothetical protein